MKRRTFIRNGLAGAALLSAFPYEALALEDKLYAHDRVKLGNTGIEMSRVAMGTGTHGFGGASIPKLPEIFRKTVYFPAEN